MTGPAGSAGSAGERVRREVLGDEHCDRTAAAATPFTAPFYEYVTAAAWEKVWARPGLDLRTRSLLTLAVLAALRCESELAMHVAAALRLGVPPEQIREALLQATVYAGAPAGNAAFAVAARVLAGHERDGGRADAERVDPGGPADPGRPADPDESGPDAGGAGS